MDRPSDVGPPVVDQAQRDAAVAERSRNVLIDAGAGTGKTTILVRRLVNMVAPADGSPGVSIDRIAAVTFTRRAAGELRLRIREELLRGLADGESRSATSVQLRAAFAGVDTAYIGTIHSFADRLLRLRPVEARLSPSYEIAEDDEPLVHETFVRLLHAVETGGLSVELRGTPAAALGDEATQTVLDALRAGLRAESLELEYMTRHGLSGLIAEFIRRRDLAPPVLSKWQTFDLAAFRSAATELVQIVSSLNGDSHGVRQLRWLAREVEKLRGTDDPVTILLHISRAAPAVKDLRKGEDFDGDNESWAALKTVRDGSANRPSSLLDDLLMPPHRWLANRLAALFPVVIALYERVKRERKVIDQVDLLLKLRDLLAGNQEARRYYQSLFDHVFVDEFQDTDPLQAEIILYLCEAGARALDWRKVALADGKLTVVGDPKQSIYRFRRADVAMYDDVRRLIGQREHLNARLSVNFRSMRGLIDWFDACFADLLGTPGQSGQLFDAVTGEVFHQSLQACRENVEPAHVHVVPLEVAGEQLADNYRRLEAEVLARYVRWLVEVRRFSVFDTVTEAHRAVGYGDIAILAVATPTLDPLFPELDHLDIPYTARGGTLFLQDPLHRQFLLGLRAIADSGDGIAQAALLRPPFFAIDLTDHVRARALSAEIDGRLAEARDLVQELRRDRFNRSPGATARDLLERTAFARAVALGPNGTQRLKRLRELCLQLEQIAATEGLDYDAATARLREWVSSPVQLDPPPSLGTGALQIMTVHQAKGLEFPVVVLWDGRGLLAARGDQSAWCVDRQQRGWSIALDRLAWDEPPTLDLRKVEKRYADAERKRVVYVAATRARDLLVVPKAGSPTDAHICGRLLKSSPAALVEEFEIYREGTGAAWAAGVAAPAAAEPGDASDIEQRIFDSWQSSAADASRARFRPVSVTGEALAATGEDAEGDTAFPTRKGRFGTVFGETVHRAIGIVLRDRSVTTTDAVRRAAVLTGLLQHLVEAADDVGRAVDALQREGLLDSRERKLHLEYPVAAPSDGGKMIVGYIDFVSYTADRIDVVDFKTDQLPDEGQSIPVEYQSQVRTYARLLDTPAVRGVRALRCALLYTLDGRIRWLS